MVEHSTADREVPGSNPGAPSPFFFFSPYISPKTFFFNINESKTIPVVIKQFISDLTTQKFFFLGKEVGKLSNLFTLHAPRWLVANSNWIIPQWTARISVFVC